MASCSGAGREKSVLSVRSTHDTDQSPQQAAHDAGRWQQRQRQGSSHNIGSSTTSAHSGSSRTQQNLQLQSSASLYLDAVHQRRVARLPPLPNALGCLAALQLHSGSRKRVGLWFACIPHA